MSLQIICNTVDQLALLPRNWLALAFQEFLQIQISASPFPMCYQIRRKGRIDAWHQKAKTIKLFRV